MLELGKCASVVSGLQIRENPGGSAHYVRLADLATMMAGQVPFLATGDIPEVARAHALQEGDLIVGARGSETAICPANKTVVGAFMSIDLYLVRADRTKLDPGYLAAFLSSPGTQALFAASRQGSGFARLPKDALDTLQIPLPPLSIQRRIAELSAAYQEQDRLLRRLVELHAATGREVVSRAIRAAQHLHKKDKER